MVFDTVRNAAYAKAIAAAVTPACTVLDLGAGLGMHGLLAAAAGAGKVFLLDPSAVVELGAEVARCNGMNDRVKVIRKRIEDAEIPQAVDIIVSVFTGNFLLAEDLLPYLFSARERFLRPGGVMIPGCARMHAALVTAQEFYDQHVACWSQPTFGVDFAPLRRFAANTVYYRSAEAMAATSLSAAVQVHELDFATAATAACHARVDLQVRQAGTCHGLLGWFDMQLGDEWLSTGPAAEPTHWSLAFLPLDPPMPLQEGETVQLQLDRPEFGEWTWVLSRGTERQRHSTFQSNPVDLAYLKKIAPDHVPGIGDQGEMAMLVLTLMAAGKSVAEIAARVRRRFPVLAARDPQLDKRIRKLIAEWGAQDTETVAE
jgi:SAM-dependent methyltransferase